MYYPGDEHGEDEFFFHEMCAVVDGVAVTEIFSVGPYAHDAAAAVVVMRAEKGVEAVFASAGRGGNWQGLSFSTSGIFSACGT